MKTARFLFLMMIAAVLLRGTSFARQSSSASQQTPAQSRQTSDSPEGQKDSQIRIEKNQTGAEESDRGQVSPKPGTRHVPQRRPAQSHTKPAPGHQVHSSRTPAVSSPGPVTLENGMGFHHLASATLSGSPNKTVSHRSAPVPPATVSVNGQQFKSARDPGARLASSGGPLAAARGTAAISGTNMKRKP